MSQLKFNCSHCNQRLECDDQFSGRQISCPACHSMTLVPEVPGKAAPALPKSGMTFVPESWRKPAPGKAAPPANKPGPASAPEIRPPSAGAE